MNRFNSLRCAIGSLAVMTVLASATLAGCTKVDDTLGSNIVPDNEQMAAGYTTLGALRLDGTIDPKRYVETRLFQTDSIVSSELSYGYMGSSLDSVFGLRTAGFMTQYLPYRVDSGYFGYKPFIDSVGLLLSISGYGSDTTTSQLYNVYEVVSNDYIKASKDTTFYLNFDPVAAGAIGQEVLFTFTFPDGPNIGPSTTYVNMTPTEEGLKFINRLMLQEPGSKYKDDYSIYGDDSLAQWVEEFKGLYIVPAEGQQEMNTGTIYTTELDASGFAIYGRNRVKEDPTLIADTISMPYVFYDTYETKYGNVSINTVQHDYSKANAVDKFDIADADATNPDRPLSKRVYVEGMGGVVTELTFTKDFFEGMNALIEAKNIETGKEFKTIAMNQVRMSIYFDGSNYDWRTLNDAPLMIKYMDAGQTRLGLYTDYQKLEGIADYPYAYEKNYSTSLAYGGNINRSRGCYVMDITAQVQDIWTNYIRVVEKLGKDASWEEISKEILHRSIFLGPEAYSLYSPNYSIMQGMTPEGLTEADAPLKEAPIKFDISYTLVK